MRGSCHPCVAGDVKGSNRPGLAEGCSCKGCAVPLPSYVKSSKVTCVLLATLCASKMSADKAILPCCMQGGVHSGRFAARAGTDS